MRKVLLITSAFLLVLTTITGCANLTDTFKDEPEEVSYTGILTVQEENDDNLGSHLLTGEDDTILALSSTAINLSNSQYLGNKVNIIGVLDDKTNVVMVTGISVLEVLQKSENERVLGEYKNTDLGFKMNYYSDWQVEESVDEVTFLSPTLTGFSDKIIITQFPYSYSPQNESEQTAFFALKKYFKERHTDTENVDSLFRKIGADLMDGILFVTDEDTNYFLYRNGLIYQITFVPSGADASSKESERIFNEMVNSFVFMGFTVEGGDTTNEDTDSQTTDVLDSLPDPGMELAFFESVPFSFKASYPKIWYYAGTKSSDPDISLHYGFSDKPVDETNELISMDILKSDLPAGKKINLKNGEGRETSSGNKTQIYVEIDDVVYKFSGDEKYRNLMLNMAASITHVERNEG